MQNLLQTGHLKALTDADAAADVYFKRAAGAARSAKVTGLESHDRFLIAYEGLFAVAQAVLALYELRPGDNDGHRVTALQGAIGILGLKPAEMALAMRVHDQRNAKIYRVPLNASNADANDAAHILDIALKSAETMRASVLKARTAAQAASQTSAPPAPPAGLRKK